MSAADTSTVNPAHPAPLAATVNPASRWDAAAYAANAAFVPALGQPVLDLLAPQPGERILDVGCGDGVLTLRIVEAGATVVGVDGAPDMVRAARERGVDAHVVDAQALPFGPEFDAAFSNAALHWMLDGGAVARGVFAALKPGGRFVGEMGGAGNIATLRTALREAVAGMGYDAPADDPQWYPDVAGFTAVYEAAGFTDVSAELIERATPVSAGLAAWFRTFRAGFLDASGVPEEARDALAARAAALSEGRLPRDERGTILADYVRLRFTMRKAD